MKPKFYTPIIKAALKEDETSRDITSLAIFGKDKSLTEGFIVARQELILSGLDVARDVFQEVSAKTKFVTGYSNGALVSQGERIAKVEGRVQDILRAERVALNFLQHLSGVATLTHKFVKKVKPRRCDVLDTRKTIPGLRLLEKRAVVDGGGEKSSHEPF